METPLITPSLAEDCVSALDEERLTPLIERIYADGNELNAAASMVLRRLRTSRRLTPDAIPADLVTMNSTIRLESPDTGESREVTLVYPEDHDPQESCWSVLSPLGAALFGLRIGAVATLPDGARWTVAAIPFQPEARGWLTM